nr:hypothetical protein [Tanacetum cinerariifolium]
PLSTPSTSRRAGIPEADTPPRNRPLLATLRAECEVRESSAAAARRPGPTMAHGVDSSYVETRLQDTERRMMAALELVNLRVSYQVYVCTRESLEFCTRHHEDQKDRAAVRAEIEVLRSERLAYEQEGIQTREALDKSEAYCRALEDLEAGARDDTLEDTGSRTEGAVGLTRWIEKMESVFNISGSTGNTNATNNRGGNGPNPRGNGSFECGNPKHFKRDCPKLKNKDGGNGNGRGWVYAVGNAERNGNVAENPNSNVVTELGSFDAIIGMD